MIDIHCHILPNIDDGAKSMEESILMAKKAVEEGIRQIIATPHHMNGRYENTKQVIEEKVKELNRRLEQEAIDLKILPGQEVRIFGEVIDELNQGDILTLNDTQYLFIEFPSSSVPRYAEKLFYDLQMKGIIPIIVHPERNQEIIKNPDLLYQFVKKGSLSQVTASSVAGYFGKEIKKFSLQLIEANLTHFIASDAHNTHNRSFNLVEAYKVINDKYGIDLEFMYKENAELLIKGKNVYREVPERVKQKKFLGIF